VLTNGVSVGGRCLRRVGGDVNRSVSAGVRAIWWRPNADCDVTGENVQAVIRTWTLANPPDYTAFELTGTKDRRFYASEDALPYGIGSDVYRTGWLLMRRIPAMGKTFFAGSAPTEPQRDPVNREDAHPVGMKQDYWIGVFEITQAQWDFVYPEAAHNSYFTNALCAATRPVDRVWCRKLRGIANGEVYALVRNLTAAVGYNDFTTGRSFDLPTEAQWEFACRAGTSTSLYSGRWLVANGGAALKQYGAPDPNLCELARNEANGGVSDATGAVPDWNADTAVGTARVGSYKPNAYGLYDMLGNAFEITCEKMVWNFGPDYRYDDGVADSKNTPKRDDEAVVVKGGAFNLHSYFCRAATRVSPQATPAGDEAAQLATALGYGARVTLPIGK